MKIDRLVTFYLSLKVKGLNLRVITEWPITSKPYSIIAAEGGKTCLNTKSFKNLQIYKLSPTIQTSVVDAV